MNDEQTSPSLFDRVVHEFAAVQLERRVKIVAALSLCMLALTAASVMYILNQPFVVEELGQTTISIEKTAIFKLPANYRRIITPQMDLQILVDKSTYHSFPFEIIEIKETSEETNDILTKMQIKDAENTLRAHSKIKYRLLLENKTYLDMLLEKTN